MTAADTRACVEAGVHRIATRHPRTVCPAGDLPVSNARQATVHAEDAARLAADARIFATEAAARANAIGGVQVAQIVALCMDAARAAGRASRAASKAADHAKADQ